jgi:hypothetical protein
MDRPCSGTDENCPPNASVKQGKRIHKWEVFRGFSRGFRRVFMGVFVGFL